MIARASGLAVMVLWLWLSTAAPAHADPISMAVVGFFGLSGTAAAVTAFVVRGALYSFASWGMSRISRALSRGRDGAQERQATVTTLSLGEVPRQAVVGRAVTGGSLVDAFNFGGQYGTDTVVRVIALADHELTQLEGIFVDDSFQGFGFSGVQLGFNGKLDIEFVNASAAGGAPPARFASAGGWTAADKMIGVAHVWVATTIDEETWTGHPTFRFLVKGAKLYNPAKDAALGYEGPAAHVWDDPSTHEFTENASVIEYNYRRGIYVTGRHGQAQHLLFGRGLTAEEAPPEDVLPWIALCDELVGGQPRYRAAGVITTADSHDVVAQWLADAMAGQVVQREGGVEAVPGHAKAPVLTITDGDLVIGEKVTAIPFRPDGSTGRYNTIIPRYVEPTQGWKDHSGPVRRDLDDIAEDGGPRELTLPLPMVTWGEQADRCAEIKRRRERLERSATLVLPPRFIGLEEGDWIAWQSDRRHEGETVLYEIEEAEQGPNWRQYLVLREISADVFEDPDGQVDESDPLTPTPQPDAVTVQGVSIHPLQMTAVGTAAVQPGVRFSWPVPVDAAIVALRAEVRLRGATDIASTPTEAVNDGSLPVTQGVVSGAWLEGRLVPVTRTTRPVVPSPWIALRVGQGVADDLTPTGPGRRRVLWEQLDEARARFDADMEAEIDAGANEALTRDLVAVLAEVNPVQRRALLYASELDLDGSTLDLLGVATRTELGLGPDGTVLMPLSPEVIGDSDLVVQLELSDAVDGLEGQIGLVAADLISLGDDLALGEVTLQGEIDAVELTVGGHTTQLGTLTSDLADLSDDLALAETTLQGEIDAVELTVGGHTSELGLLTLDLSDLTDDLASAEATLGGDIATLDAALLSLETDFGVAETKLATIEEGAEVNPLSLLDLDPTAAALLDEAVPEADLLDGTVRPLVSLGVDQAATVKLSSAVFLPVAAQGFTLQAGDGETVDFPQAFETPPIVLPASTDNLLAHENSGDYWQTMPVNVTSTGFTGRARRRNPGTGGTLTPRTDSGSGNQSPAPGASNLFLREKALAGVAYDGQYVAEFTCSLQGFPAGGTRSMTVGFYGRAEAAGAWTLLGQRTVTSNGGSTPANFTFEITGTSAWTSWPVFGGSGGDQFEYKVEIISGYIAGVMYLTDFVQVEYVEQSGASGEVDVTALPSGGKLTYIVLPQSSGSESAPE